MNRLDLLRTCHGHHDPPRWTLEVQAEIQRAASAGIAHCRDLLATAWLGDTADPSIADLESIARLQIGLNDGRQPATDHLGEAESMHFAEKTGGRMMTDDHGAYEFARRRSTLGPGRVIDTVDVLRTAVAAGDLTAHAAAETADEIEAAGRHLRPPHRSTRGPAYFH